MGQKLMQYTASLEATDAKTFVLKLEKPFGLVLDAIGKISSNVPFMMPKRLAETDPFSQIPEVIGSGPFKFLKDEWVPGSKVVYAKRSEEHTSELQSLLRISYAVLCLKKKNNTQK